MAILRSSHKAGQTNPQDKPFEELISRLGQPSQLAAPKYEDSTKRHAPTRHILVVERREKNFVTLILTVHESCSVGIYVYVNICKHVCIGASSPPSQCPMSSYPASTTTGQS